MAESKRYYWIKLKTNFFNMDEIDFLLSQKNGCEYIVLYQMLCLNTANNHGEMSSKVGEMIVPYDVNKIVRDTKYFDYDTVVVALELFKKLGLVYEEENKLLRISNFEEMVGSETSSAKKVREWRKKKELQCNRNVTYNVIQEKEIENRDKSIDIDINNKKKERKKKTYDEIINSMIDDIDIKNSIYEFIKMRKLIKKPMTDRAVTMLINKLNKLSNSKEIKIKILEKSILKNWSDIYPYKEEGNNDFNARSTKRHDGSEYAEYD